MEVNFFVREKIIFPAIIDIVLLLLKNREYVWYYQSHEYYILSRHWNLEENKHKKYGRYLLIKTNKYCTFILYYIYNTDNTLSMVSKKGMNAFILKIQPCIIILSQRMSEFQKVMTSQSQDIVIHMHIFLLTQILKPPLPPYHRQL